MFVRCPVCGGEATVISTTGLRAHYCPNVQQNVWWHGGLFLVGQQLTEEQVTQVIVHGKRIREVTRKEGSGK